MTGIKYFYFFFYLKAIIYYKWHKNGNAGSYEFKSEWRALYSKSDYNKNEKEVKMPVTSAFLLDPPHRPKQSHISAATEWETTVGRWLLSWVSTAGQILPVKQPK